ncbi:STT3 domain-containing protein [Desulfurobacterium sp.]
MEKIRSWKFFRIIMFIVLPIAVGLYIRFDDLSVWRAQKARFYFNDRPLFTSYDAFYFARWSEDYLEGKYRAGETDPLRFVPDNYIVSKLSDSEIKKLKAYKAVYPDPIPLESFMGAVFSRIFHTHIENVALYLTPVLAVLFVIPLVVYMDEIGAPIAGFSGAVFGVTSLMYLARTTIARFDTDSLNLFFPFLIAYFFHKTLHSKSRKRYVYAVLAGLSCYLFNWWYAHPDLVLIMFIVFIVGMVILRKKFNFENLKILMLFAVTSNPFVLYKGISIFVDRINTYILNFGKTATQTGFPNVMQSISEAQRASFKMIVLTSTGNTLIFLLGFTFIFVLFFFKWRDMLFLIPPFMLGLMAFKSGNRFVMYLAPFVGMGFGYVFDLLLEWFAGKRQVSDDVWGILGQSWYKEVFSVFVAVTIFVLSLVSQSQAVKFVAVPKITPSLEAAFLKLKEITPDDAWIWTWWDYGTAIQYLSRRAVYHDGQSQLSPKTYFVATTFSASSPEVAFNVINGISHVGVTYIEKWLDEGLSPETIRDKFFKGEFNGKLEHPVYWIFTEDEIGKFAWINYFGTWNFDLKKGVKDSINPVGVCKIVDKEHVFCGGISIDIKSGVLNARGTTILNKLAINIDGKYREFSYNPSGRFYVELVKVRGKLLGFIMDEQPFYSMFNQMYILRHFDKHYFSLVYDGFPAIVVYKVISEDRS